jgi:hypothetical protein
VSSSTKKELAWKVVKIDTKIIISLPWFRSTKVSVQTKSLLDLDNSKNCGEKSGSIRINVTSLGVDVAVSVVHWHGTKNRNMSKTSFFSREMNLEGCSWADFNQKIYAEAISFSCEIICMTAKLNHTQCISPI